MDAGSLDPTQLPPAPSMAHGPEKHSDRPALRVEEHPQAGQLAGHEPGGPRGSTQHWAGHRNGMGAKRKTWGPTLKEVTGPLV